MSQETVTSQESETTPAAGVAVGGVVVGVVGLLAVVVAQLALVKRESSAPGVLPAGLNDMLEGIAQFSMFLGATACAVVLGVVALGLGLGGMAQRVDAWARGALILGAVDIVLAVGKVVAMA